MSVETFKAAARPTALACQLVLALAATVATNAASAQVLDIVFDYSLDTTHFFTQEKRSVLEQVASIFEHNITSTLPARSNANINLPGFPGEGGATVPNSALSVSHLSIPANTITFYLQSGALESGVLGMAYLDTAHDGYADMIFQSSPQSLADQLGYPMFGVPTNPYVNETRPTFYFDDDIRTFETQPEEHLPVDPANPGLGYWILDGGIDFASVVMHEMGHTFGLDHSFNPTDSMYPSIGAGERKFFDANDWNAIVAAGWSIKTNNPDLASYVTVPSPVPEPETYAMMLAGLAALGFGARRRQAKAA